jgi:hypothetical protein
VEAVVVVMLLENQEEQEIHLQQVHLKVFLEELVEVHLLIDNQLEVEEQQPQEQMVLIQVRDQEALVQQLQLTELQLQEQVVVVVAELVTLQEPAEQVEQVVVELEV